MSGQGRRAISDERFEARKVSLTARSIAAAEQADFSDPSFSDCDDTMWFGAGTRGQAMAYYASEFGCAFTEVRCRRRYMAIDFDAIRDRASDIAADENYSDEDIESEIAYTYDGEGWLWVDASKGDPHVFEMWECTRAKAPA